MKYWNLKKNNQLTLERTGIIPRSISKLFNRFKKELDPNSEIESLEEFKVIRYQTVASVKYVLFLLIIPIIVNQGSKHLIISPMVNYFWNQQHHSIFLNKSQEERAFAELQLFEEKIYFEMLIGKSGYVSEYTIKNRMRNKALELATQYNVESSNAITNILADILSILTFVTIIILSKRQLSILKSFINELIYGLSDTAKAFLIILFTDIFVGFHSPHGWEVIIEAILRHFGLPESRDFIFLFISTFPVILDTVFKYWIFRYLNRISPSAVATYHNMNE